MMTPTSGRKMSAQRIVFFPQFTCGTGIAEYIENATKIPLITLFILFSLPLSAIKFRKRFRKLHLHPVQFFHEAPQVFADNFLFPADNFLHPKRSHWKRSPTYHNMISIFYAIKYGFHTVLCRAIRRENFISEQIAQILK